MNEITEDQAISTLKDMFPSFEEDKTIEDLFQLGGNDQKETEDTPEVSSQTATSRAPDEVQKEQDEDVSAFDDLPANQEEVPQPPLENKLSREELDAMIAAEMQMEYQKRADQYLIEQQIKEGSLKAGEDMTGQIPGASQHVPQASQHATASNRGHHSSSNFSNGPNSSLNPSSNSTQPSENLKKIVTEKVIEEYVFTLK